MTLEQIIALIKQPASEKELQNALLMQSKHRLHVIGEGFEAAIKNRILFESDNSFKVKAIVGRAETPPLFSQIINIFKKVFHADGFETNLKFKKDSPEVRAEVNEYLKNISFGISLFEFMQIVWFKACFEDYNGVILIELPTKAEMQSNEDVGEPVPNPIVKLIPTKEIHDICVEYKEITYLILKMPTVKISEKIISQFRFIDRDRDIIINKDGEEYKINIAPDGSEDSINHEWGCVPAMQVSQIWKTAKSAFPKKSFIETGMGLADQYFDIANDHSVAIKLHQHPIFYCAPVTCPDCNGRGETLIGLSFSGGPSRGDGSDNLGASPLDNPDAGAYGNPRTAGVVCKTCNGEKVVAEWKRDPTKSITVPIAENQENGLGKIEAPGGYIMTPVESLDAQRVELDYKSDAIEKSILGVKGLLERKDKQQTAAGQQIDLQPVADLLDSFSANGEQVATWLMNMLLSIKFKDNFVSAQQVWGRDYFLKTESQLTEELSCAKKDGAPSSYVKDIIRELIMTRYEANPSAAQRSLMLLDLEPFPAFTVQEVLNMNSGTMVNNKIDPNANSQVKATNPIGIVPERKIQFKIFFNDLIDEFERDYESILSFESEKEYKIRIKDIKKILNEILDQQINEYNYDSENSGS